MKNVLVRLQEYSAQASGAEKGILSNLLTNPESFGGCSIHELAERTFSSPSTIIRLCHKTGFDGYKEFQKSLMYELAVRKEADKKQMDEIKRDDSLEAIVDKVTYKNIVSLENTRKLVDLPVLQRCVELLRECSSVYLFGMGSSLLVARDAYLKFLRVNKSCHVCDDWHAQLLQAMNIRPDCAAIIISYSGLTQEMIRCAKEIRQKGAPIIVISRFEESPLAKLADYNLCVAATEFIIRSGAMSSRISQLNMIDILYTAYMNCNFDDSMKQLRRTHINKPAE